MSDYLPNARNTYFSYRDPPPPNDLGKKFTLKFPILRSTGFFANYSLAKVLGGIIFMSFLVGCGGGSLYKAIDRGNIAQLNGLISQGADIEEIKDGGTPLIHAAYNGNLAIVKILINEGANVNAKNPKGMAALHFAADGGSIEMAQVLLESGALINTRERTGMSALHIALRDGYESLGIFFINNGADVKAQTKFGDTPLHWAASHGFDAAVKELVRKGAEINARNNEKESPLLLTAKRQHPDLALFLISQGADVDVVNHDGETPMYWAAYHGQKEVVRGLLQRGADLQRQSYQHGLNPLMVASMNQHKDIIEMLLDSGAEIPPSSESYLGAFATAWAHYLAAYAFSEKDQPRAVNHFRQAGQAFLQASEKLTSAANVTERAIKHRESTERNAMWTRSIMYGLGLSSYAYLKNRPLHPLYKGHPVLDPAFPPDLFGPQEIQQIQQMEMRTTGKKNQMKAYSDSAQGLQVAAQMCHEIIQCYESESSNPNLGSCLKDIREKE